MDTSPLVQNQENNDESLERGESQLEIPEEEQIVTENESPGQIPGSCNSWTCKVLPSRKITVGVAVFCLGAIVGLTTVVALFPPVRNSLTTSVFWKGSRVHNETVLFAKGNYSDSDSPSLSSNFSESNDFSGGLVVVLGAFVILGVCSAACACCKGDHDHEHGHHHHHRRRPRASSPTTGIFIAGQPGFFPGRDHHRHHHHHHSHHGGHHNHNHHHHNAHHGHGHHHHGHHGHHGHHHN